MKISLLILLGLTMAFMVQIGEGKKKGYCGDMKEGESYYIGGHRWCNCPMGGGKVECMSYGQR
jgi:hypothetical protein